MNRPTRILHVLGGMDRGGVETWLMHVLRNIDRQQFQMDFLVHTDRRCAYDDEIESLGSKLHFCTTASNPISYARNFFRILRAHGPYDVVHSHVHHFSGFVVCLAKAAGVPRRIAHSHSNTSEIDAASRFYRRLYLASTRRCIKRHASTKLAASREAAINLFGSDWKLDPSASILYCGIDLAPFGCVINRAEVRGELGFDSSDFVIGHVGRLVPAKNHDFLLRIHAEILKAEPNARLLLIGQGPLESILRAKAGALNTSHRVTFAAAQSNVARMMIGAMDVFVMPSLYEGLGLAAVEAQAAGLPTVLSDTVPAEADTGSGLVRFLSLQKPVRLWAEQIMRHATQSQMDRSDALASVTTSSFNITRSLGGLCRIYSPSVTPRMFEPDTAKNQPQLSV